MFFFSYCSFITAVQQVQVIAELSSGPFHTALVYIIYLYIISAYTCASRVYYTDRGGGNCPEHALAVIHSAINLHL